MLNKLRFALAALLCLACAVAAGQSFQGEFVGTATRLIYSTKTPEKKQYPAIIYVNGANSTLQVGSTDPWPCTAYTDNGWLYVSVPVLGQTLVGRLAVKGKSGRESVSGTLMLLNTSTLLPDNIDYTVKLKRALP